VRNILCSVLVECSRQPDFVFLTGDLGFMALEPLQQCAGNRFINAGVAEQNMVAVAAGLARAGLRPWVYSIAPFVYARPFEQIRNDVCYHQLPVFLVGNGGGYAYGVMGPTHHALEDYGVLLALPHMTVYVPAFAEDVSQAAAQMGARATPAYLRLGRDEKPKDFILPEYAPWRRILDGHGACLVVIGPLAGALVGRLRSLSVATRPSIWVISELPIGAGSLPEEFLADLRRSDHLVVVEEHVAQGGAGQMLAMALLLGGHSPRRFEHRFARGYPGGNYGSQPYHRKESGLDAEAIAAALVPSAEIS